MAATSHSPFTSTAWHHWVTKRLIKEITPNIANLPKMTCNIALCKVLWNSSGIYVTELSLAGFLSTTQIGNKMGLRIHDIPLLLDSTNCITANQMLPQAMTTNVSNIVHKFYVLLLKLANIAILRLRH